MSIIQVSDVSKWFGEVVAVNEVSFELGEGVTGLLGPNGAGKSTLLRLMAGLLEPNEGEVRLFGRRLRLIPKLYKQLGLCPEPEKLYGFMTGFAFVEFTAELYGLSDPKAAAHSALEQVDLLDANDRKVSEYSQGMRQRLKFAQSIVHDPKVLLLDEPLRGVDPKERLLLIELIHSFGDAGKCVVVSSHVLYEVERMVSEILLIHRGRLIAAGDFHAIREAMDNRPHRVLIESSDLNTLAVALIERSLVESVQLDGEALVAETSDPNGFFSELPKIASGAEIRIRTVRSLDDDLESVFRYLTT